MRNIFLIVEGQSEESFYKHTFSEYFKEMHFYVCKMPVKKNVMERKYKGGSVTYEVCITNIKRFINQASHCEKIFLIYDYYGLHETFTNHFTNEKTLDDKIASIKGRIEKEVNNFRFHVFLQIHEFEAFLFSNPEVIASHYNEPTKKKDLIRILEQANYNPEFINNSRLTAPSKRLIELFPTYENGKTTDGVVIAQKIGIQKIKDMCPYFKAFCDSLSYN